MKFSATVVITTKNRKEDLRRALRSAVNQSPQVEVLVIDDGSTDGTTEMVTNDFSTVRVVRSEKSLGLIVQRNRAARLANAPIIFSIDDDAEFSSPRVVAQTLAEFNDSRVGAVNIPVIDTFRKIEYRHKMDSSDEIYVVEAYAGTCHALRVDLFLKLGGYREILYRQGEEGDYCARLLDAGYVTRWGDADSIYHHVSPIRSWAKIAYWAARNDILFAWTNVPFPYLLIHLPGTTFKHMINSFKARYILSVLKGLSRGYYDILCCNISRNPISTKTYRLMRRLRKIGPLPLSEIEKELTSLERM